MSTGHPDETWLVADIGGTNARFALVTSEDLAPRQQQVLGTADYAGFPEAVKAYLRSTDGPRPVGGLCAIANPVQHDFLRMTNHHWAFSIEASRKQLGFQVLRFVNDFSAQALAMPWLEADEYDRISGGTPRPGEPLAVLGPGTGLGVSALLPNTQGWQALDSEGGHVSYTPVNPREQALANILQQRYGHCSAERIVSGPGLVATYTALCDLDGRESEPLTPVDVSRRAACNTDRLCSEAIEIFTQGLATTASNLALTLGAGGGVYLVGGLLPKLGSLFESERFYERFITKGRFSDYLASIPVYRVNAAQPALRGLAHNLNRMRAS